MVLPGTPEAMLEPKGQQEPQVTALGDPQGSKDAPLNGAPADQVVKQPAGQTRKHAAAEGLSPAGVVPQQPSTPSEESKEPAGRPRRGSRQPDGTQLAAAQRPAGRVRAAKLPPQPAATQPKASRPKPGRGRRTSADPQAAQPAARPQRARPSRASAVAAAGFLAKVITAEVDGKDVSGRCTRHLAGAHANASGDRQAAPQHRQTRNVLVQASEEEADLGYQANFRRAAKRKPVEELQPNVGKGSLLGLHAAYWYIQRCFSQYFTAL
jgi:hypothetical protein